MEALGLECQLEYGEAEYWVDMVVPAVKLAVEADGPSHFLRNTLCPDGATLMKRRILAHLGWTVASVPYHHWIALPDSHSRHVRFSPRPIVGIIVDHGLGRLFY